MIQRRPLIEPQEKLAPIIRKCNELISIFVTSVKTAERNK